MEYDYKILEEKFKQLPKEIQIALTSTDTVAEIQEVSKNNSLNVEQEGILFDQTSFVMLGLLPASEFVRNFSKEAGVKEDIATSVAKEINDKVLGKIRSSIRLLQNEGSGNHEISNNLATGMEVSPSHLDLNALEQLGGIRIEQEKPPADKTDQKDESVTSQDKTDILNGIENPDPLIDHLLASPVAMPAQRIERKDPVKIPAKPPANLPGQQPVENAPPKPPEIPKKPAGPDPYREPIK